MTRGRTLSWLPIASGVGCKFTRKIKTTRHRNSTCNCVVALDCYSDLRRRDVDRSGSFPAPKCSPKNRRHVYDSGASTPVALTFFFALPFTLPAWRHRLECLYICLFVRLIKHQANLLYTSIEKRLHLIATLLGLANNGHRIHHLIRHELCRSVALTRLVSVSDAIRVSAKTDTVKVLMVK